MLCCRDGCSVVIYHNSCILKDEFLDDVRWGLLAAGEVCRGSWQFLSDGVLGVSVMMHRGKRCSGACEVCIADIRTP